MSACPICAWNHDALRPACADSVTNVRRKVCGVIAGGSTESPRAARTYAEILALKGDRYRLRDHDLARPAPRRLNSPLRGAGLTGYAGSHTHKEGAIF